MQMDVRIVTRQTAAIYPPGMGPSEPNLTVSVPTWSEENFVDLLRHGVGPGGSPVSDEIPWKSYNKIYTDDQRKDLYTYLHVLQPVTAREP